MSIEQLAVDGGDIHPSSTRSIIRVALSGAMSRYCYSATGTALAVLSAPCPARETAGMWVQPIPFLHRTVRNGLRPICHVVRKIISF